ncbi:TPA: ead/Ea22-like family protein [Klebsiella pneumoniae]|nr:ead/Ea22-like family protein [Klebsiella pneumoniae]HBR5083557.1 ead/Ea22-like family protein [Klebsiella pneumoniae]
MTDITKLAQSLKAAAENAIGAHERLAAYPYGEIIDISQQEGEQIDIDITDINEFLEEASPANILALVEALEKSEKTSEARREAIGITHKRAARERDRANAAEEALEKAQAQSSKWLEAYHKAVSIGARYEERIADLESRTVKLPDGWQFEECEAEDCENGAIFSVGTGSRNIHLCDKCAHEPQNSRLKKSPLSKRLPFKMSAGIKVEAE